VDSGLKTMLKHRSGSARIGNVSQLLVRKNKNLAEQNIVAFYGYS